MIKNNRMVNIIFVENNGVVYLTKLVKRLKYVCPNKERLESDFIENQYFITQLETKTRLSFYR